MEFLKLKTATAPSLEVSALESATSAKTPIVMAHGAAMGSWDYEEYFMPYFFDKGYNTYALNWRGYGASELDKDYDDVTLDDCVVDLRRVVEMVRSRTGMAPIIMGHSQGGAVTQMYLKEHETERAVFLGMADFAYLMPPVIEFAISRKADIAARVNNNDFGWFSDDKDFQRAFMFGDETNPKMDYWANMMAKQGASGATVSDVLTKYSVGSPKGDPKVLIVTGALDPAAIPESVESGVKAYDAHNLTIEGMFHGVPNSKDWRIAADGILDWLEA